MIKIIVSGACGKMGKRIISLAKQDKELKVISGIESSAHPDVGKTIDGVKISADLTDLKNCDCLIEFSSPEATLMHLGHLVKLKRPAVIGTTGLIEDEQNKIKKASAVMPIVFSPNMSVGVNLIFRLVKEAARILKGYQVNIEEVHHLHKKDSPSGTAKKIAEFLKIEGFSIKNEDIKSIREGEIIGDHRVIFESDVDKVTLSHSAKSRDIFAKGALLAAKWIVGKPPRLYSVDDVLFK